MSESESEFYGLLRHKYTGDVRFLPTALTPLVLTSDTEHCRHKMAKGAKPEPWNREFLVHNILTIFPLNC